MYDALFISLSYYIYTINKCFFLLRQKLNCSVIAHNSSHYYKAKKHHAYHFALHP
jgi:hypothetical protein